MIETNDNPIIHNYKVAGDKINEFWALYLTNQREGIIVEIDKYGYDEPAWAGSFCFHLIATLEWVK